MTHTNLLNLTELADDVDHDMKILQSFLIEAVGVLTMNIRGTQRLKKSYFFCNKSISFQIRVKLNYPDYLAFSLLFDPPLMPQKGLICHF